ncbi:MAG: nitrogen regulatory protein P-II 1 [Fimbriimonadales bacterium]|nr:MAG: nitrogen regulatory protein P-II 1 [Fimbriimonadales bacterium]GIV10825.1 MAG: nitrogen regulatory protein P-II 1 [Fimbriimonadales bacterium]
MPHPDCARMKKIDCIIRPHKLEQVKTALNELGITGMTVSEVRGCGNSAATNAWLGDETLIRLPIRLRLEMVVSDEMVELIIEAILHHASTGQPDDGKIFVSPYRDAIRIRTEERGEAAL